MVLRENSVCFNLVGVVLWLQRDMITLKFTDKSLKKHKKGDNLLTFWGQIGPKLDNSETF